MGSTKTEIGMREKFYQDIDSHNMAPLWEVFRSLVTPTPVTPARPHCWYYQDVRDWVLRAGDVITAREAERRVLVLENPGWATGVSNLPDNSNNSLYQNIQNNVNVRNYVNASNELSDPAYNMVQSVEYEKLENARLLSPNEYSYNAVLGFISLNQSLNNDEVLAIAYQYTYNGQTYQVGELSTDGITGQSALYLKLLKSTVRNPRKKLWDLMMKNVYSLGYD